MDEEIVQAYVKGQHEFRPETAGLGAWSQMSPGMVLVMNGDSVEKTYASEGHFLRFYQWVEETP